MRKEYIREAPQVLLEFLNYTENVQGRSSLTVDEYYRDLRTFFRFIIKDRGLIEKEIPDKDIDISIVDLEMVKTVSFSEIVLFMNYCQYDRNNNNATRARKTSALNKFFEYYAVKTNKIPNNPTEALSTPKKKQSLPKYLTLDESLQLLRAVDGDYKERDYCILIFLLNCGMRVSELCGINLSDISSDNMLTIRGKGNKERILYLNEACVDALKKYLAVRDTTELSNKDILFISRKHCRITPKGVQHLLDHYIEKSKLSKRGISPHKLRHTAATLMYQKGGVDIRTLQAILGHENLGTTQIYTHIASKDVIDGLKSNPLSKVTKATDTNTKPQN